MKRLNLLYILFLGLPSVALGNALDTPEADFSVFSSAEFEPVRRIGSLIVGVLLGIAVIMSLIFVISNAIKLQGAGNNVMKQEEAKKGLTYSLVGLGVALGATALISIVLFTARTAGLI